MRKKLGKSLRFKPRKEIGFRLKTLTGVLHKGLDVALTRGKQSS